MNFIYNHFTHLGYTQDQFNSTHNYKRHSNISAHVLAIPQPPQLCLFYRLSNFTNQETSLSL